MQESKPFHLGDVNADGVINGMDLALARQGVSGAFSGNAASLAADVDQSGSVNGTDLQLIQDYLLGKITEFPIAEKQWIQQQWKSCLPELRQLPAIKQKGK